MSLQELVINQAFISLKPTNILWQQQLGFTYPVMIVKLDKEIKINESKSLYCAVYHTGLKMTSKQEYEQWILISEEFDIKDNYNLRDVQDIIEEYKKQKERGPAQFLLFLQLNMSQNFEYCEILNKFDYFQVLEIMYRLVLYCSIIQFGYTILFDNYDDYWNNLLYFVLSVVFLFSCKAIFNFGLRFMLNSLKKRQQNIIRDLLKQHKKSYAQDIKINLDGKKLLFIDKNNENKQLFDLQL